MLARQSVSTGIDDGCFYDAYRRTVLDVTSGRADFQYCSDNAICPAGSKCINPSGFSHGVKRCCYDEYPRFATPSMDRQCRQCAKFCKGLNSCKQRCDSGKNVYRCVPKWWKDRAN